MKILIPYCKKDMIASLDPPELFRKINEGILFFEKYTGTKYPW